MASKAAGRMCLGIFGARRSFPPVSSSACKLGAWGAAQVRGGWQICKPHLFVLPGNLGELPCGDPGLPE